MPRGHIRKGWREAFVRLVRTPLIPIVDDGLFVATPIAYCGSGIYFIDGGDGPDRVIETVEDERARV